MSKIASPNKKAVHSIDHFALHVPSLDEAERFYTTFGLQVERTDRELNLRAADAHRWARILPATGKSLAYVAFNCYEDDLQAIRHQATQAGANFDIQSPYCTEEGIWFRDPDGNLIQVQAGPRTMPETKSPFIAENVPPNTRGAHSRSEGPPVRPRRLSHLLLFTPDVLRAIRFYDAAIGLQLSDRSGDAIAFTHAPHGCDHHLLAFAKSESKGFHHCAWDVDKLDDVGRGAATMQAAGYKKGWGTGRHVLGSNYFYYVQDP